MKRICLNALLVFVIVCSVGGFFITVLYLIFSQGETKMKFSIEGKNYKLVQKNTIISGTPPYLLIGTNKYKDTIAIPNSFYVDIIITNSKCFIVVDTTKTHSSKDTLPHINDKNIEIIYTETCASGSKALYRVLCK